MQMWRMCYCQNQIELSFWGIIQKQGISIIAKFYTTVSGDLRRNSCVDEFFIILKFWNMKCFPLIFKRSLFLYLKKTWWGPVKYDFIFWKLCQFYFLSFSMSLPKIMTCFQVVRNHLYSSVQGCWMWYTAEVTVFANVALVICEMTYRLICHRVYHLGCLSYC